MSPDNSLLLLRNEWEEPTHEVLEQAMGKELFAVYQRLTALIKIKFSLDPQWRFYKDGKAWLCKIVEKKKTIFWLSIWQNSLKASFYFTDKTRKGVMELEIDSKIKKEFGKTETKGKLIALILDIEREEQLKDLEAIIAYKKGLL